MDLSTIVAQRHALCRPRDLSSYCPGRRAERPCRPARGARPCRPARGARPCRPARGARPCRPARGARPCRPARGARPCRPARGARPCRPRLSAQELRLPVSTMLFASQDTTRHQLGLAMTTFLAHPDQWRLLAEQPELATQAVEEILRTAPVIPLSGRVAAESTFHGLHIPAGARIHILINAANTDPAVFGQTTFDITATRPAPQLTFGGGSSHHCLGAFLARTELAEALPILARGLRDPRLAGTPQWRPPVGVTGPVTLPLRFTPTRQPFET